MTILPRGVGYPTKQVLLDAVTLRFARLTIDFQPADKSVRFRIDETHLPFVVSNAVSPDLELRCRIGEIEPPTGAITFSAGNAWELRRAADGSEDMIIPGASKMVRPVWHVRVDPAYRHGVLTETSVTAGGVVRADGYPLLEYLVARLAGRHGGLLIHASTAILDGVAYVFVGHSGAGKSTVAALAEAAGARIPTDDRTMLTVEDGDVLAWGTPWHGSLVRKSPEGAPVRGIYLLQQSDANELETIPPGRAIKELFVRLIQPRLHSGELMETLRLLECVVERLPVAALHFRPTPSAFELAVARSKELRV